jgi:membrane protein
MLWKIAKDAAESWSGHKDSRQGAALAYYSVFSIGPLIVIAIAIAGSVFGRDAVSGQVALSIKDLLGETGAKAVQAMLVDASRPREGLLATVLGVAALLFAAIGVVVQLKDALNTVWEVEQTPGSGLWYYLRSYILSFAGVLALGFLLLVSLLLTTALAAVGKYSSGYFDEWILHVASLAGSFSVISLLFATMFKWLPDAPVDWYDVWLGAILTAAFFEIGKLAIGFYIGKQGLESTYGAAASIIVVLIWVYYSSQIILMGAEITHAFAIHKGSIKNREPPDTR